MNNDEYIHLKMKISFGRNRNICNFLGILKLNSIIEPFYGKTDEFFKYFFKPLHFFFLLIFIIYIFYIKI